MEKKLVEVIGVRKYEFRDRDTQELRTGCSVFYVPVDTEENNDVIGRIPQKASLSIENFYDFSNGPGRYEANFDLELNGSRPRIVVKGFKFVEPEKAK